MNGEAGVDGNSPSSDDVSSDDGLLSSYYLPMLGTNS